MRILVTGAAGFVGSHMCRHLASRGHEVFGSDIDDADLSQPGSAVRLVDEVDADYVVHLAARYGRLLCADEPHLAVQDNAAATTELAAACAERGIPVLYASSSEIYGDHGTETITEDSELRMPTTIYGLSKRWGEEALRLYLPPEKLCVVRMNMLYGPGQQAGYGRCALATFIACALEDKPFCVHRGTSRSWLYVSDAVSAMGKLIEGAHTGTFNLGNETERLAMTEVAELVVGEVGGDYRIEDPPPGQIRHKNYSSAKLRATIDWRPETELRDGLRRTIAAERKSDAKAHLQGGRHSAGPRHATG